MCDDCWQVYLGWLDYDRTPVQGWRNYPPRVERDLESRKARVDDRRKLINQQLELVKRICREKHQEERVG